MQELAKEYFKNTAKDHTVSLYLTNVILNLTNVNNKTVESEFVPQENANFTITIYINGTNTSQSTFQYQPQFGFDEYRARLDPPIRIHDQSEFQFTVHLNDSNWLPKNIPLNHILSTSYIDVVDFCTVGMERGCDRLVWDLFHKNPECSFIDEYDFQAKYGYCNNSRKYPLPMYVFVPHDKHDKPFY